MRPCAHCHRLKQTVDSFKERILIINISVSQLQHPGILIEDQTWPKSCGHVRNKRVVSREEAVSRIRAAADAR